MELTLLADELHLDDVSSPFILSLSLPFIPREDHNFKQETS